MVALRRGEVAVISQWSIYPTRMQLLRVGPKANAKGTGGRKMFERFVFVDRHFFFFGCVERKYQVLLMRVLTNSIQTISCGEHWLLCASLGRLSGHWATGSEGWG
jgi:hypothetical protein